MTLSVLVSSACATAWSQARARARGRAPTFAIFFLSGLRALQDELVHFKQERTPLRTEVSHLRGNVAALLQEHGGLKRVTPKLHGVRTIVDVAGDRRGRSHLDDLAEEHRRPPYAMQF